MRQNYSSGAVWEDIVGYSRAVKIGNTIEVAGTVALVNGELIGKNDAYLQTKTILEKISAVLEEAGASIKDVVRTRIYLVDITMWEEVGKAHGEFFKEIKPASTMLAVKDLISPDYLVEIEVTAIISI